MRSWAEIPLTVRAPILVALMMVVVSVVISERVMTRLADTQERQLEDLATAYLDGLSSALIPHVLRDDVWEVYDTLDRSRALYQTVGPVLTAVVDRDGLIIAATDPDQLPSMAPLPREFQNRLGSDEIVLDLDGGQAFVHRELDYQLTRIGSVYAILDVRGLVDERTSVVTALLLTNSLLTLLLAGVGYLAVRRLVAPIRTLTDHLANGGADQPEPISEQRMPRKNSEARRLYEAYNRLVLAGHEREKLTLRLAEEERLASLGRLASGMAHEINNPLGGLFNALSTIRRHGHSESVRDSAVNLVERGLTGIRDVVAAALHVYRPERDARPFGPDDIADVRVLVTPELQRRSLGLAWQSTLDQPVHVDSSPLRQVLLNLVLNACAASDRGTSIEVRISREAREIRLSVADSGVGLPDHARALLASPDCRAPIGENHGLGLWMVRRAVTELGGTIETGGNRFGGTTIDVRVPVSEAGQEHGEIGAVA